MKRILLMVILLSVPLCAQTPEAKSTPAAQQSITVSKLPPVTIAKNGIDWAVLANYLLVAVGVGGIAVAIWTLCYIRQQVNEMRRQRKLMLGTLKAIQAQAGHMETQTGILKDSVAAAQISANAAAAQIQLMKSKERARLEIKPGEIEAQGEESWQWWLVGDIELSNLGQSNAYILRSGGEFIILNNSTPKIMEDGTLPPFDMPYHVLKPSTEAGREGFWSENIPYSMPEFAQMIVEVDVQLFIRGFVEYETLGSVWRRDFAYTWIPGCGQSGGLQFR